MLTLSVREIHFYYTDAGFCPVKEFLDSLTGKQAQKILWVMQLVEDLDRIPKQYFKKLVNTQDIWEIRAQIGSKTFRILGFFISFNKFIATNGFKKKTQKTSKQELILAEKSRADYLSRRIRL